MEIPRFRWQGREELVQEIDARVRIKDIQLIYDLKDALEIRWWEPLLKMVALVAGIGFAVTFLHFLDRSVDLFGALDAQRERPLMNPEALKMVFWFIAAAFSLMLVAGMLSVEVLMARVAAMRRLHEIELRVIEHLQAEVEALREQREAAHPRRGGTAGKTEG